MYILGIHTGHGATVGLLEDGRIVACASEERFSRKKNYIGWPGNALAWILESQKIGMADIELVTVASKDARTHEMQLFNPGPFLEHNKPTVKNTLRSRINDAAKRKFIRNPRLWEQYLAVQELKYKIGRKRKLEQQMLAEYARRLGIDAAKILFVDHHYAHATATAYNLPRDRRTLVFTLDGEGDDLCASVNIFDGTTMHRIAGTRKDRSLGWLYFQVTRFLGMKGIEHEFKVMGLAPYAKPEHVAKIHEKLKDIISLDPKAPLVFKTQFPMPFAYVWLNDHLRGNRFDNIAGGVQQLTEELIMQWVAEGIRKTGISDIAVSGGVFMNVKANQRVMQMPEVTSLFVMPSAGDESLVFGTMWHGYKTVCEQHKLPFVPQPFADLYLGRGFTDEEIDAYLKRERIADRYSVRRSKNIEEDIATLLAKGEIVARLNGRAEWGARALGNRSILANPSNFDTVKLINEMIKNRDFWMPFTPSMLDGDDKRYILNPKNVPPFYMCITFDSTPLARKHLPAALHPYDQTIRPQVVLENWNPSYYRMLNAFKKQTGIAGVLNTSFNLHGEPNVDSPADAIHALDDSGLRNLAMGNFLIQKR